MESKEAKRPTGEEIQSHLDELTRLTRVIRSLEQVYGPYDTIPFLVWQEKGQVAVAYMRQYDWLVEHGLAFIWNEDEQQFMLDMS
ncbi:MAG: hypothetical protein JO125_17675 [Chloroflexi bacterium]|nr:hypothetical protein [Chloroflexota bacterium]